MRNNLGKLIITAINSQRVRNQAPVSSILIVYAKPAQSQVSISFLKAKSAPALHAPEANAAQHNPEQIPLQLSHEKGQRQKAIEILKSCPVASCGYIMLGPVEKFESFAKEFQAGTIGDHYESIKDELNKPATEERLKTIAENETKFWRDCKKGGSFLGAIIPAKARFLILKNAFDKYEKPKM